MVSRQVIIWWLRKILVSDVRLDYRTMMRTFLWSFVIFGIVTTIVGLLLPIMPGLPFLYFVSLGFDKLCPEWWHQRWLYVEWLKINRKCRLVHN